MMELLVGTNNPSKLKRMKELLAGSDVICLSPAELNITCTIEETAMDAAGNALEKAHAWHDACGLPVYTEDSGLIILDLERNHPDQPGVHVRRVNGSVMDDEMMRQYYQQLAHQYGGRLNCAWQSAHCLLFSENEYVIFEDDESLLLKHAFVLTDQDNGKRLPGWPLESLKSNDTSIVTPEDKQLYWSCVEKWLREHIECRINFGL